MTYDKVTNSEVDVQTNLWETYDTLRRNFRFFCKLGRWSKIWPFHSKWWSRFPV